MISNVIPNVKPNVIDNVKSNLVGTALSEVVLYTTYTTTLTINLIGTNGKVVKIDWGDESSTEHTLLGPGTYVDYVHDYGGAPGSKTLTISGDTDDIITFRNWWAGNLTGTLLSSFSRFSSLTYLLLVGSNVGGDILQLVDVNAATQLLQLYAPYNSFTGDIADILTLPDNFEYLYLLGSSLSFSGGTFPEWGGTGTGYELQTTGISTSTEIDNLLIGAADGGMHDTTYRLDGNNPARTSASDAAVATLAANGVILYVN